MNYLAKLIALAFILAAITLVGCDEAKDNNKSKLLLLISGGGAGTAPGYKETYTADGVTFKMVHVPGGKTFPTGTNDEGTATVANAYWIGETEATYELCYKVFVWATTDAGSGMRADGGVLYSSIFGPNPPRAGHDGFETDSQEPVTFLNWRHAMVWCNALTEWYNAHKGTGYACVYYTDSGYTTPLRSVNDTGSVDSTPGGQDNPYVKPDARGFRLPTSNEWELASRYIDGTTWLYGDHASGDQSGYCYNDGSPLGGQLLSTVFGNYAVYEDNSGSSTAVVRNKTANALGLYDMSGNVWEWCFDWYPGFEGSYRVIRGGGWASEPTNLRVGLAAYIEPYFEEAIIGFRFSRSAP